MKYKKRRKCKSSARCYIGRHLIEHSCILLHRHERQVSLLHLRRRIISPQGRDTDVYQSCSESHSHHYSYNFSQGPFPRHLIYKLFQTHSATSQKAFPPNLIIIMKFLLLLLLCIQVLLALPSLDPYQVLGLPPRASRQQIRRAFKELSLQYHPDINPNEQKRYQTIIEAYETLKKTSNQEEAEPVDFQGSPSYVDLEDLLNRIELQMRQESSLKLNEGFIPWCIRNPRIILAVLLISTGLVFVCK